MTIRVERLDQTPPCSRCGGKLLIDAQIPVSKDKTVPVELCPVCDAGRGAGGRLLAMSALPESERSASAMAAEVAVWMREAMAAQGWRFIPGQRASVN